MKTGKSREQLPSDDLRRRAEVFIARAIPAELKPQYVSGSLADIVIASYAKGDSVEPELLEIAELSAQEYDGAIAQARTPELRDYYRECQSILSAIIAEGASQT